MNNIDALITKHFPFKVFNPGQKEAIAFVVNSVLSGKKHIILQAPTGIGKSAIAITTHKVLRELRDGWRTTIITATKGLQDQYEQEDSSIFSLKGKKNYPCPLGGDYYTGPDCMRLRAEGICKVPAQVCSYLQTRDKWTKLASLRLTNTAFQVVAGEGLVVGEGVEADMIVADECHELDENLVQHSTLNVNVEDMKHLTKVTKKDFINKFADFINLFMEHPKGEPFHISKEVKDAGVNLLTLIRTKIGELEEKSKERGDFNTSLVGAIDELTSILDRLSLFVNQSGEWLVTDFEFSQKVEIKPVYAYQVSQYALFRKAKFFLHMSATICGFDEYMSTLGIAKETCATMDLPNPIPVGNRKVFYVSKMKVSGQFDRGRLTVIVDSIVSRYPQKNGVIHTVSFALANEIRELSRYSDKMTVSNNRQEILSLLSKQDGNIVLSPSVEKGYDFKGDMCRFQILAKVPWGALGDPWISLNVARSNKWYARKAILRLVQASGRAVRGVTDYADTYVIDQHFERLMKQNWEIFPEWYLDSVETKK